MHKELAQKLEALSEKLSSDADTWNKHLVVGLGAVNGLGLLAEAELLQATAHPTDAAHHLLWPALLFVFGLAASAVAASAAARSAALLSRAYFSQRLLGYFPTAAHPPLAQKVTSEQEGSQRWDKAMWAISALALALFVGGLLLTS